MQTVTITLAFILLSIAAHLPGPRHRAEAITQARANIQDLEQSIANLDSMEARIDSAFAGYELKGEWYLDKKREAARLRERADSIEVELRAELDGLD